jgi:putative selenium metabolism hydrolase
MSHTFADALRFAQDLIRIPSPPGGERAVAERVVAELEALRFDEAYTDDVGNVIGIIRGTATANDTGRAGPADHADRADRGAAPAVMLSSHLDIVDAGDVTTWEYPPFDAVVADGYLHGRGAMDIKGPLALQTYAAAQFVDQRLPGDVIIAHTVMEERGGWGMEHLMADGALRPGAVIIGEATNGDICVGHRGRAELIIDVIGKAGHASAPERALNPLEILPHLLPALRAFNESMTAVDPLLGRSTAVPTAIETLPRSRNVIPDIARVVLDWRVLPSMTAERAVAELTSHLEQSVVVPAGYALDVRFSVEPQKTWTGKSRDRRMFTPGFLLDPEHAVVRAAADVVRSALAREPAIRPWTFATDGGHTCGVHGIPTIGFAPGEERYAHTNIVRLVLVHAERVYGAYPALIRAVSGAVRAAVA